MKVQTGFIFELWDHSPASYIKQKASHCPRPGLGKGWERLLGAKGYVVPAAGEQGGGHRAAVPTPSPHPSPHAPRSRCNDLIWGRDRGEGAAGWTEGRFLSPFFMIWFLSRV